MCEAAIGRGGLDGSMCAGGGSSSLAETTLTPTTMLPFHLMLFLFTFLVSCYLLAPLVVRLPAAVSHSLARFFTEDSL